ncbi:MAG TPA: hypothetical protein CFH84_02085 [Sulfurimonas sp. UBA12504]|nr:MAG: hypothetical protein A2019_09645 [Sulfurimonas sp. GWF2_37_8]DAB30797.1 MAG TPA: hypothetical protein CFH84_02085 [Sulfurimonas sp. UBA12504]
MIRVVFFLSFTLLLHAIEYKSDITSKYISYDSFANESAMLGSTKLKFDNALFTTNVSVEYFYSSEYKERRYLLLNELYLRKDFEDYSFTFGKSVRYFGEMEGFNIADIYNQKNYILDSFDKSAKLGSWGFFGSKYFGDESLEIGLKFYEEDQKYPTDKTPYTSFSMEYDETLQLSDKRATPTLMLIYSFVSDKLIQTQNKIILLHGYDNKRYFLPLKQNTIAQYAYQVNKYLLLSNAVYKETIFKLESSYTDVLRDTNMGDYAQLSFGAEKIFYDFDGADIGLYSEYYRYIYLQNSLKNVAISELYDNDAFVAVKLSLNDVHSSEIKGGILYDLHNHEEVYKVEVKSRVVDGFILNAEFLRILPKANTLFSAVGESTRCTFSLTYNF